MSFIYATQHNSSPPNLPRASASFNTRMARDAHHWPRADGHLKRCGKKLILKLRTTFPLREFACDASFGFGSCCWSSLTFGARQLKTIAARRSVAGAPCLLFWRGVPKGVP